MRADNKPPVELVVGNLDVLLELRIFCHVGRYAGAVGMYSKKTLVALRYFIHQSIENAIDEC